MSFEQTLTRCIGQWRAEGIELAPPIPEAEIRRVWESRDQPVSRDVLLLYSTIGGFQDYVWSDEFQFTLWPWRHLLDWNASWTGQGLAFCDHCIEIETWVLRYESVNASSVWFERGERAAPSLDAFLPRLLDDPWGLLLGIE